MAKIYNISDKIKTPTIRVKDNIFTVMNEPDLVTKVMEQLIDSENKSENEILDIVFNGLLGKEQSNELKNMHLDEETITILILEVIAIATDDDPEEIEEYYIKELEKKQRKSIIHICK